MAVAERVRPTPLGRDLAEHRGQWVAIKEDVVVAAGETPAEVLAELRRAGIEGAALDRVPDDPQTVYIL